jgi:hypothetical protein
MTEKQIPFPGPLSEGSLLPTEPVNEATSSKVTSERKKGGKRNPPLKIGDVVNSPYKPPKRKIPIGSEFRCIERHHDKNYPTKWEVVEAAPPPKIVPKKRGWVAGIEMSQPRGDRE